MTDALERVRQLKDGKFSLDFPLFKGTALDFQKSGAEMALLQKKLLLMDPTGLGKTIQALLLISKLLEERRSGRRKDFKAILAVGGAHVFQWQGELRKFLGIDAILPLGKTKASRNKAYENIASRDEAIVLINHSKLFVDFDNIINKVKPTLVVIDEAAIIANKNKTHQYAAWVAKKCEYSLLLTAEPITRGDLLQIRNCFQVLGIDLMGSEEEFVDRFVITETKNIWAKGRHGNYKRQVTNPIGVKNLKEFKELIFLNAIRRPETVLGEKRIINRQLITVEMSKVMRERYKEIEKKLLTDKGAVREINPISMAHYLSQVLCSPYLADNDAPKECPKGEALAQLCKKIFPEKIVVFSKWKTMHRLLFDIFQKEGIKAAFYNGDVPQAERDQIVRDFTDTDKYQVVVVTQAGKEGLNLQVARNIALLDLLHSPAAIKQLLGRIDRIGQKEKILNFFLLVAEDSTEMNIMKVLKSRQSIIDGVFDEDKAAIFDSDFKPEELLTNVA